jgi:glycosyltransferase involved in cell wall biosynthesis
VIRVGFIINPESGGWLGGVNYFRNLIGAVCANPERNLEPVILTGFGSDIKFLEGIESVTIIRDHIFDSRPYMLIRHVLKRLFHRDILLERLLARNNISLLSHSGSLGRRSKIPTIGWIPDFQHKYLPEFFSHDELINRVRYDILNCSECTSVIFSSNTAKSDAEKFYPEYEDKYRVVHFVTGEMDLSGMPDFNFLVEKYNIKGPYFIVPNQFWIHKNHIVILEALGILKSRNQEITVIATGSVSDYRQPGYFGLLMDTIQKEHLSENFLITGIVPYKDLLQLMIHAVAVINPSLFEGWSTSVEESKALGVKVILSDIPVHREQNPEQGIYFPPHDPGRLADILIGTAHQPQAYFGEEQIKKISENLGKQKRRFAENYEQIVLQTIESARGK